MKMKIFKIIVLVLITSMCTVSCKKSACKPHTNATATSSTSASEQSPAPIGRSISPNAVIEDNVSDLVSSGDEDRDGGDKKKKKIR